MPNALCHRYGKKKECQVIRQTIIMSRARETIWRKQPMVRMEDKNNNCNCEEEDSTMTMSSKKNHSKVVNKKLQMRRETEETASSGQKNRQWQ